MSLSWNHPWLLALAPLAVAWAWWRSRQPHQAWLIPAADLLPRGAGSPWPPSAWARLASALAAVLAVSGPSLILPEVVPAPAALMVVLDVSASMAEADIRADSPALRRRIDAAVDSLMALLSGGAGRSGWQVGLATVAGRAEVVCPPVPDPALLEPWLRAINPVVVPGEAGTDLASGLALSLRELEAAPAPARAVLLVSDGENNAYPPESGLSLRQLGQVARALGIVCHSLEVRGERNNGADSKAAREMLDDLAGMTGGRRFEAGREEEILLALAAMDESLESRRVALGNPVEWPLAPWLAAGAALFLPLAWRLDGSFGFPRIGEPGSGHSQG